VVSADVGPFGDVLFFLAGLTTFRMEDHGGRRGRARFALVVLAAIGNRRA
jgi:hypothetical protein